MYHTSHLSQHHWNIAQTKGEAVWVWRCRGGEAKVCKVWGPHRTRAGVCSRNHLCSGPWLFGLVERLFVKDIFLVWVNLYNPNARSLSNREFNPVSSYHLLAAILSHDSLHFIVLNSCKEEVKDLKALRSSERSHAYNPEKNSCQAGEVYFESVVRHFLL